MPLDETLAHQCYDKPLNACVREVTPKHGQTSVPITQLRDDPPAHTAIARRERRLRSRGRARMPSHPITIDSVAAQASRAHRTVPAARCAGYAHRRTEIHQRVMPRRGVAWHELAVDSDETRKLAVRLSMPQVGFTGAQ